MKSPTILDIEAIKYWRKATKGMTKEERLDFAKWIDELK